jgi:hypothetical protein
MISIIKVVWKRLGMLSSVDIGAEGEALLTIIRLVFAGYARGDTASLQIRRERPFFENGE